VPDAPAKQTSPYRQLQAQQTRDRIADAARGLFATQGYGSTSMDAIASAAGVANRTVYSAFKAKREILAAVWDRWQAASRADDLAAEVLAEPSPRKRLRAAAHWLRQQYDEGYDVLSIIESVSDEDEETRDLVQARASRRQTTMDEFVTSLADRLRRPAPESQAIFRALAAPAVYRELVLVSGWSPDAFEEWIADALVRQLLGLSH
jgi:AcrR family transcriptional regulator